MKSTVNDLDNNELAKVAELKRVNQWNKTVEMFV